MKRYWILLLILGGLMALQCTKQPSANALIEQMTLEEKAKIVVGMGMNFSGAPPANEPAVGQTGLEVPGAAGNTYGIPRLNIPSMVLADGPAGLRIQPIRSSDSLNTYYATAFPIATLLASSWDEELVRQVGQSMGQEVLEYGVDVILMPALNLHRHPLCGRNFEYYSEDPLLSGYMAAAMVQGIQSSGVGTSIKHYVANNQEKNRNRINAVISERALRELYLRGFEYAVKKSQPWTVMSSYNKVNGTYTSESRRLITDILRKDWGFDGFVMTDWFGGKDAVAQMKAGNDLLMPGTRQQTETLIEAVRSGELDESALDANVTRILQGLFKTPVWRHHDVSNSPDLEDHALVARKAASEGMVLLKNEQQTLPLSAGMRIALCGNAAYELEIGGTGSGDVNEAYSVSLLQGLKAGGFLPDADLVETYDDYLIRMHEKYPKPSNPFFPAPDLPEMAIDNDMAQQLAGSTDIAIWVIGRNSGEFSDRKLKDDYYLSKTELKSLAALSRAFRAAGKKLVVVLNTGGVIDVTAWRSQADAVLLAWQPGQEGGHAISDVLSGKVNPSGRLPMTFPMKFEDVPSSANFPGVPKADPDSVVYAEDIYVGYRHYSTRGIKPAYAFGAGLSYTEFSHQGLELSGENLESALTLKLDVVNTGQRSGRDVVQLYISAPAGSLEKPVRELRAFAKTGSIKPGGRETVTFRISAADLVSYDVKRALWVAEAGTYDVIVASNASDAGERISFRLNEERTQPRSYRLAAMPESTEE